MQQEKKEIRATGVSYIKLMIPENSPIKFR
jgi:hypothetical protein